MKNSDISRILNKLVETFILYKENNWKESTNILTEIKYQSSYDIRNYGAIDAPRNIYFQGNSRTSKTEEMTSHQKMKGEALKNELKELFLKLVVVMSGVEFINQNSFSIFIQFDRHSKVSLSCSIGGVVVGGSQKYKKYHAVKTKINYLEDLMEKMTVLQNINNGNYHYYTLEHNTEYLLRAQNLAEALIVYGLIISGTKPIDIQDYRLKNLIPIKLPENIEKVYSDRENLLAKLNKAILDNS